MFKYLSKSDFVRLFLAIIFIFAGVALDLKLPDYMREITTLVQTQGSSMNDVLIAGAKMLGCALLSLVTTFIVGYFVAKVAAGLAKTLRELIFSKTVEFSKAEISEFSTASLITRTTNDVQQIQLCIAMGAQALARAPIMAIWAALKIANKSWQWAAITAGAVVFIVVFMGVISAVVLPKFKMMQKLTDNLNSISRENLSGLRVIRAYNAEAFQQEKFDSANSNLTNTQLFTSRRMSLMFPTISLVMSGLTLAIYWSGVFIINDAQLPDRLGLFSDMVVFSSYAIQIVMSFMLIVMVFIILPRATVAAKRIEEVLKTPLSITDAKQSQSLTTLPSPKNETTKEKTSIEFKNVSFKYPDAEEKILHDISFKAEGGQTVAFIGSTGSGKSTLIQLFERFYDCTSGEILINGENIQTIKQKDLRDKIGYVTQKPILFKGTIKENVEYGKEENDERLAMALSASCSDEFVEKLADGVNSKVSQGGTNFSGGQKQRLSIARAIFSNPEIYIFDDSFSALDYKTDRAVRSNLSKVSKDALKLIVAQRIGTILEADEIIVLDAGKIVGCGKHSDLIKTCPIYQEIAKSQLSIEELQNV
jgi:ATP-binding cassette, subfamily B, multidrug efflux pump